MNQRFPFDRLRVVERSVKTERARNFRFEIFRAVFELVRSRRETKVQQRRETSSAVVDDHKRQSAESNGDLRYSRFLWFLLRTTAVFWAWWDCERFIVG